ncbi:MAG: DNA polymerase III subunit [Ignavibacteria bacterium]|nr:DNA polymerase III subunit [Ignavibacteria bacterium]
MSKTLWPDVIGQHRVKEILLSAWHARRLPHAYLFYGDEGVGKSAMAMQLARLIHCERGEEEPCGMCDSCVKIRALRHPDVKLVFALPVGKNEISDDSPTAKLSDSEINAVREQIALKAANPYHRITVPRATVIKINSIREIRRESTLSASGGAKKIFIVLNADEMLDPAANTLLKTLEEPSLHTMLILTTSHRDALLPTIVSRCQQVRFDQLTGEQIQDALVRRRDVDSEQARILARLANGSYTRALDLDREEITSMRREVLAFIRQVLGKNTVPLAEAVEKLSGTRDRDLVVRFLTLMLVWFRDALVLSHGGDVINVDQSEELTSFLAKLPDADLVQVIGNIEKAISLVERNVYIQLVLLQLSVQLRQNILNDR